MNENALLKDLSINQLNMREKRVIVYLWSLEKKSQECKSYVFSYSKNIMKHWLYVCHYIYVPIAFMFLI